MLFSRLQDFSFAQAPRLAWRGLWLRERVMEGEPLHDAVRRAAVQTGIREVDEPRKPQRGHPGSRLDMSPADESPSPKSRLVVELFLDRLAGVEASRLLWLKTLRTDTKVYSAAKAAIAEATRRSESEAAGLRNAQQRAREILEAKVQTSRLSLASELRLVYDAIAGLYLRGSPWMPSELSSRLYRPFDDLIPEFELNRRVWELQHPEEAARQIAQAETAEAAKVEAKARAYRQAPVHWGTVIGFMGDHLAAVAIGVVLGLAVNWQLGVMMGSVAFLALKWGVGPTHAWSRINRYRDLKRVDAKTRSVIDGLDALVGLFGTLLAIVLLVIVGLQTCGPHS